MTRSSPAAATASAAAAPAAARGHGGGSVTDDPDFLGDQGIPVEAGHSSSHPAPGVAMSVLVSYRAAH